MKVIHLSLLLFSTIILSLSLTTSLGPGFNEARSFIPSSLGLSSSSQYSTDPTAVLEDDITIGETSVAGSSSEASYVVMGNDYLPTNGETMLGRDSSHLLTGPNQSLLDFRTTCTMIMEHVKVSVEVFYAVLIKNAILGLWAGLVPIVGVVTKQQPERSPTSSLTFKKSRPRIATDTVSFRIDSNLRSSLEDEAKKNRTSLNTLVSQVLSRYADWWRYAGRLGLIPVSKDLLRDVFKSLDKPELEDLGRRVAETSGREHVLYLYQQVSLGTVIQFLDLWSSHFDAYEHRYDGKIHFYTVHHDVNLNFSTFVKEFVSTMIMGTVPRTVRFETVAPNSVTFSFEG
jgi:hypothetical protein